MASVVNLLLYGRDGDGSFVPLRMDSNGLIAGSGSGSSNPPPIAPAQVEQVIHAILCAHTETGIRPVSLIDGKFPIVVPDGTGESGGVSINWSFLNDALPLSVNQAYLIANGSDLTLMMPAPIALNDRLLVRSEVGSQWTITIQPGTIVRSSQGDSTLAIVSGEGGGFDAVSVQLSPPIWFLTAVYGNLQTL